MVVRGVVIMLDITEMKKLLKASLPHKRLNILWLYTILLLNWQLFTDWIRKRLAWGHYCTIAGVRYLRVIF